jgi:hypothetical protein
LDPKIREKGIKFGGFLVPRKELKTREVLWTQTFDRTPNWATLEWSVRYCTLLYVSLRPHVLVHCACRINSVRRGCTFVQVSAAVVFQQVQTGLRVIAHTFIIHSHRQQVVFLTTPSCCSSIFQSCWLRCHHCHVVTPFCCGQSEQPMCTCVWVRMRYALLFLA